MTMLSEFGLLPLGNGPIYDRPIVEKRQFELFYILSELVTPQVVLEIGSWEGRSALSWCDATNGNATVICVDTWLGSIEHYQNELPNSEWERSRLFLDDGYPSIYKTFVSNIRMNNYQDFIIAMPIDSHQAFIILEKAGIEPDITYIDASHDYDSVMKDLVSSKRIGSKIICGDDYYYYGHTEVKNAVDDFAKNNNMKVLEKQRQYIVLSNDQKDTYEFLKYRDWNDS